MTSRGAMSIPEAAKWLGISKSFAYTLAARKIIPTQRLGKRVLVLAADLPGVLEGNKGVTK